MQEIPRNSSHRISFFPPRTFLNKICSDCGYGELSSHQRLRNYNGITIIITISQICAQIQTTDLITSQKNLPRRPHFACQLSLGGGRHTQNNTLVLPLRGMRWDIFESDHPYNSFCGCSIIHWTSILFFSKIYFQASVVTPNYQNAFICK